MNKDIDLEVTRNSTITRLHTQNYGTLDYDPSVPCIIATHIGFMPDHEFKSFLDLGLEFMIEKKKIHGKIAWLPDTSQMAGNTAEEWTVNDWNPRALASGIEYIAFVLSDDVFGQMQVHNYVDLNAEGQSDRKMKTKVFTDLKSAKDWLHEALSDTSIQWSDHPIVSNSHS